MIKSINHIGIAVKNLEVSLDTFKKLFQVSEIHMEEVTAQKVKVASFKVGNVILELTQAIDETSPIAKFIEKKGEGIHHIAFETDNVNDELDRLKNMNFSLINENAVPGAHDMQIAFLHPKSTNSVLTELCQQNKTGY
ncbi:MAG: methylmalonyl-CoA epimerase [Ignavibacteria bacterium GWF2_33_9]|nr:MAG: methylmalonyl-CoA epimerase [Ignavibacteria bacterium GWF2_33_9]